MKSWKYLLSAAGLAPLLLACVHTPSPPVAAAQGTAAAALVKLMTPTGEAAGQAVLTTVPEGVKIVLDAERLTPGLHGFHIHANGVCGPGPDAAGKTIAFGAAGGHFDPAATARHGQHGSGMPHHAGDAPNLSADAQGKASLRFTNPLISLGSGPTSVIGKTLVVHADADDYKTNPAGNSGARVLCGVIESARLDAVLGRAAP